MMAAILALSTFLILMPPTILTKGGETVSDIIPKAWAGSNGVITAITAIFVSFFVAYIFCYCEKNHIGIKMPDAVPQGVAKAFTALVPGMIFFTSASVLYGLCHYIGATTLPELIFKVIQTPLQGLSDSLAGGTIIVGLQSILFWAGIHGPNVVGGVVSPLLIANSLDNQHLLDMGMSLVNNPQAKTQINDVFVKSGGCGLTLGLLISGIFTAKSDQLKSLMKMAFVPGLFNINEPLIFGLPIVFNPYLFVPFIIVPLIAMFITYGAIASGFMAPLSAVQVPWTTPPIIAGFLLDGWQGAVIQLINLVIATVIYFPFLKAQDRAFLKEEMADAAAEEENQGRA